MLESYITCSIVKHRYRGFGLALTFFVTLVYYIIRISPCQLFFLYFPATFQPFYTFERT